jgi:hypothetical protein
MNRALVAHIASTSSLLEWIGFPFVGCEERLISPRQFQRLCSCNDLDRVC